MLDRLQAGLEALYRIETAVDIEDYVIDDELRSTLGIVRTPREQLLISQDGDDVAIGLFVDPQSLANLRAHDPRDALHNGNFQDFLFAVEGVSHFLYSVWRARSSARISALELELQGEVDKFITCLFTLGESAAIARQLGQRLFYESSFDDDLSADERERYEVANRFAELYATSLERRFLRHSDIDSMLAELRGFYRKPLAGKIEWINRSRRLH